MLLYIIIFCFIQNELMKIQDDLIAIYFNCSKNYFLSCVIRVNVMWPVQKSSINTIKVGVVIYLVIQTGQTSLMSVASIETSWNLHWAYIHVSPLHGHFLLLLTTLSVETDHQQNPLVHCTCYMKRGTIYVCIVYIMGIVCILYIS